MQGHPGGWIHDPWITRRLLCFVFYSNEANLMNVFRKLKGQLCLTFASFQFLRLRSSSTVAWSFNPRKPIIGELQLTVTWLPEAYLFPKLWSDLVWSWPPAHSQPHSHFIYFTLDILTWSTNTVSLMFESPTLWSTV